MSDIWAIIPVKEFDGAKHRLSDLLSPPERLVLAATMLADMLDAVAGSRLLAGVMVVTLDPNATVLGKRIGARERNRAEAGRRCCHFERKRSSRGSAGELRSIAV